MSNVAIAFHIEDVARDALAMLRDLAYGNKPDVEAARELVKSAQTVLAAIEATKRVLEFGGGDVRPGDLVEVPSGSDADKASQYAFSKSGPLESRREADGIASLLSDTAAQHNSDRDCRNTAAE